VSKEIGTRARLAGDLKYGMRGRYQREKGCAATLLITRLHDRFPQRTGFFLKLIKVCIRLMSEP